jgi:hypothetical protein
LDGGLHAQAFRSEGNIGSPTGRASNGIDPRADPECIDVCAKDPSSGQLCGVKALFPILGAAFVAGELAGRPCSTINLSTLTINLSTLTINLSTLVFGAERFRIIGEHYQQCVQPSRSWDWLGRAVRR